MRVQYILGLPGTGKTTLCHKEIAEKQHGDGDNPLILIVPEQFSFQSEKALIAATGSRGLWRAQVLSFHRLSYYVFGKTGGIERKILEDAGKHMLLRKIVNENKKQLVYFKSSREKKGFVDALAASITEFFQYNINPAEILARAEAQTAVNLRLKLLDLHLIYLAYKEYLEKEYISSDEILDVLAEKIPQADFLRGAEIWIDGFKSFTPQDKKVLSALISVAKSVKITLCVNSPKLDDINKFDAFFEAKDTMRQINFIAEGLGAAVDAPIFLDNPWRYEGAPDIGFLCANFLGQSADTFVEKPKNIRIFSADTIFGEIATAAKTVTMLTRDRGYRYCDIGMMATNLAQYEKYMPAIFSQYGIPVFVDNRRDILGHPLAEMIFAALEVASTNWQYEAVFRLLRCALSPIPTDEVDLLENYVLAYNIRGKAWLDGFSFGPEDDLDGINTIRAKAAALMAPFTSLGGPKKSHKIADIAAGLYCFAKDNGIDQTMADWIAKAQISGDNEALRQHEQIWGKIMGTLDKLVEILGEGHETFGDFAKILEAGMTDLGIAPPSLDQLVVGDLRRSRFGEIKALIILGANEGALPSRPETGGLLGDGDRSTLAGDGMNLAKDYVAKIYEEEFLIYASFAKPREYLVISYHNGDLEGGASSPTRLIERLTELFPQISITHMAELPENSVAHIAAPQAVFGDMAMAMGVGRTALAPIYQDAYAYFRGQPKFAAKLENIKAAAAFTAQTHGLSPKAVRGLYGRHMRTSVSKLERFINCPFSYFVEYNLATRPRKLYEATAVDMGTIYHDILSQFGKAMQEMGDVGGLDEKSIHKMVDAAIEDTLASPANQILDSSGKYQHYASKMKQISRISATALAKHLQRGDFALVFNEVAFSDFAENEDGLSLGAIEIPLGEATMRLDGRIDRVDIGEIDNAEYVKIIDYKSGQRRFSLSEAFHGLDMQLLVYLHAFIQKLSETRGEDFAQKILPAAAFYFNLLNPVIAYGQKFQDDPEALKAEVLRSFKMSGIVVDEADVIYAMDRDLTTDSQILPVSLKKGSTKDALSFKKESAVISAEGFYALMGHVMGLAKKAGREILDGNIDVAPAKHRDKHPCKYCNYRSICKFDAAGRDGYRHMRHLKNDEVIDKLL
ncbi:MAG: exodeoxyribonuclease V subunit gamma [Defluviitaleaceae bacterium]|nr:exodeoxyribonuclease V subunit gamma [Defluviitaleaceae bacterium]